MDQHHTPGPWFFSHEDFAIRYDDRRGLNVTPVIAWVENDNTSDEQATADARLIAAAPVMLTALKDILELSENMGGRESECWRKARDAIAAATESPTVWSPCRHRRVL